MKHAARILTNERLRLSKAPAAELAAAAITARRDAGLTGNGAAGAAFVIVAVDPDADLDQAADAIRSALTTIP